MSSQKVREDTNTKYIENGGWHLSYFGDAEFIKNKLKNFSHQEFNVESITNTEHIKRCIKEGLVLFDNTIQYIHIPLTENKQLPVNYEILIKYFS